MSLSQSWLPPYSQTKSNQSSAILHSSSPSGHTFPNPARITYPDTDYLSSLHARARQLEHQLQALLDSQSTYLSNASSNNIRAQPTSSSTTSSSRAIPVRQPPQPAPSLTQIRRAFSTAMTDLSALHSEESAHHAVTLSSLSSTASSITSWQSHLRTLNTEIAQVERTPESARLARLSEEDVELRDEIEQLEVLLFEKKARQRALRVESKALENSVESRVSSFRAAREILGQEIRMGLNNELQFSAAGLREKNGRVKWMKGSWMQRAHGAGGHEEGLDDALETAAAEVEGKTQEVKGLQEAARAEQVALEEGVEVWDAVSYSLRHFERKLASWMQQQQHVQLQMQEVDLNGGTTQTRDIMEAWDETLHELQDQLGYVEERGWKLLICCIGAEVAALEIGRDGFVKLVGDGGGGEELEQADRQSEEEDEASEANGDEITFRSSLEHTAAHGGRTSANANGRGRKESPRHISPVRPYVRKGPVRLESEDGDDESVEDEDEDEDAPDADMLIGGG